ncbi:MAG: ATPase [candidate division Zixibacteria bacterium]|nr:ATPase [candidate division Zixibacteria bacterium]
MKRCSRCVLPSSMPGISFDSEGICNYCRDYQKQTLKNEEALLEILNAARGKGSQYDCIVNLSGGRDSSYTILKMSKDYGMKVLAINYRNPFTHPIATRNMKNIKDILGVNLIDFSFKPGFHERILKQNLLALLKKTDPAMIPMVCISCKLIWKNILKIAKSYNVKLIVSGGNLFEQTTFKRVLLGGDQNQSLPSYYSSYIFGLARRALANYRFLRPRTLFPTIKGYLYSNPYSPMVRMKARHIDKIDLFHYLPWNEKEILGRIQNELNWQYPESNSGSWRFDCQIGHLKDFFYLKTLGLTEKDDFYSKLIREGKISREDSLIRLAKENEVDIVEIRKLLKSINFDTAILTASSDQFH